VTFDLFKTSHFWDVTLQETVESAVHAESKDAAKAARKILWTFVEHRAVAGLKSWCSGLQNLCCSDQCRYISLVDLL
jgi:hypothetical protein